MHGFLRRIKSAAAAGLVLAAVFAPASVAVCAAETVDRIVAVVNDDIIRLRELEEAFRPVAREIRSKNYPPGKEEEILYQNRMEVLDYLIDKTLADQVIEREGISVSEAEIDKAVERVKERNYFTDEDLRRSLRMSGMDMQAYRENIRRQILQSRLVNREVKANIVITDSEIREYYEKHRDKYQGGNAYKLKNIFMACGASSGSNACSKARRSMSEALAELESGKSFESVARKYSEGSNASEGGDLGVFAVDDLQKKLRPVVKSLEPGEFSSIVETDMGLQVFYLEEIVRPEGKSLEKVSDDIRKKLYKQAVDEKYKEWIKSLREDAHIRIIR